MWWPASLPQCGSEAPTEVVAAAPRIPRRVGWHDDFVGRHDCTLGLDQDGVVTATGSVSEGASPPVCCCGTRTFTLDAGQVATGAPLVAALEPAPPDPRRSRGEECRGPAYSYVVASDGPAANAGKPWSVEDATAILDAICAICGASPP